MSAPSVLERARMALCEIGLDPDLVQPHPDYPNGFTIRPGLTDEERWLLHCTTVSRALCLPCHHAMRSEKYGRPLPMQAETMREAHRACRADRPFQRQSCGATR